MVVKARRVRKLARPRTSKAKMPPEDYAKFSHGLLDTMQAWGIDAYDVNTERRMWEIFHMAWNRGGIVGTSFYRAYSDRELEAVMKKVFSGK